MSKYINADKLIDEIIFNEEDVGIIGSKEVIEIIQNMPSADVRENIHGVWIYDIDGIDWGIGCWKCSICNAKNDNIQEENKFSANPLKWAGSNFCPNCGADMRGETE